MMWDKMFWSTAALSAAFLIHFTSSVFTVGTPGVDVCATCHVNATCEEMADGRKVCNCMYGFVGNGRTYCQDKDECQIGANKICGDHTTCHNTYGSFYCTCLTGYSPSNNLAAFIPNDGTFCEDVDECQVQGICGKGAQCSNIQGSFNCHCQPGYRVQNGPEPFQPSQDKSYCKAVNCGPPPRSANAVLLSSTGTSYLSHAVFGCLEGFFRMSGNTSTVCGAEGVWEGLSLVCEEVNCGNPPSFPNAAMLWNQSSKIGAKVQYECHAGFYNAGESSVSHCTSRGHWSMVSMLCAEIKCGDPPVLPHTSRRWNGSTSLGSRMEYYCDEGFQSVGGEHLAVCTGRGLWTNVTLQCEALCGPAPQLPHAVVVWQNGRIALHRCQDGYSSRRGSNMSLCDHSQTWHAATLLCREIMPAISKLEVFNEHCLRWKAVMEDRNLEHYTVQFVGSRAYQKMFQDKQSRVFKSTAYRPELCMNLLPGTNYSIHITAQTANFSVTITVNTSIPAPPAPHVIFRDVEGPSPTLTLRRAIHSLDAISVYQVFVLLLKGKVVFDCISPRALHFHDCKEPCREYVAAEIQLAGMGRKLSFMVGDQQWYGGYYNAPLETDSNYYVILRAVSQWGGVKKQSCVIWAKVRGESYIIQSATLMVGGSIGLVAFIILMGYSYNWYCKKQ